MKTLVVLWAVFALLFIAIYLRRPEARSGLVLAYVIVLVMNYWLAGLVYTLPAFRLTSDPMVTQLGLEQSLYGLIAFIAGSLSIVLLNSKERRVVVAGPEIRKPLQGTVVAWWYLVIGAGSYALLLTVLQRVPSGTSIAAAGQQLFVVGICLLARDAWGRRQWRRFALYIAMAALLPFVTIVTRGFIGFGMVALISVAAFVGTFARPKPVVVVAGLALGFMSLSLYVTYLRDRPKIRDVVWGGAAPSDRVGQLGDTLSNFEVFSFKEPRHLAAIDDRMNLDYLTGAAVRRIEATGRYANGSTLAGAALSFLPRALMPDKPKSGGSALVTRFTGIRFYGATTVGMGHVMEFYVNFGTVGVTVGFFLIGVLVTVLDRRAALRLAAGDQAAFATTFIVGLSMLQSAASLSDVVATMAASLVLMTALHRTILGRLARPSAQPDPSEPALAAS